MPFKYIAITPAGEQVRGSLDAPSADVAEQILWDGGYRVLTIQAGWTAPRLDEVLPTVFGIKPQEVVTFSRQMATLVESGIAVLPALELLQRQQRSGFARVVDDIAQAIKEGASFSDALARHPEAFPSMYSRMVAVGERSGTIETLLRQLAGHIEKEQAIIKKVRGAMAYPAFMVGLAIVVIGIMVTSALPPLVALFDEFDSDLPLPTRILIAVSDFAMAYKLHMAAAGGISVGVAALYLRQPSGRRQLDYALLRAPLFGPITVASAATRFSGTMAILFKAGLPLSEVMNLVLDTTPNVIVREGLTEVREELLRGEGLSQPLANSELFPPMLVQMVEIGEQTGTLDSNLDTMAEFYAREVDDRIGKLTSLIQPVMTLGVGAMVAFIAVSVIMPMYQIMNSIR